MNLFMVHHNPVIAAEQLCDAHVVKMASETAQLLSTAIQNHLGKTEIAGLWKKTHAGHPMTIWAGRSRSNFLWALEHGLALCSEYSKRYGRTHAAEAIIHRAGSFEPIFDDTGYTSVPLCFGDYKPKGNFAPSLLDAAMHYRDYYRFKALHFKRPMKWKNSSAPSWMLEPAE